MSCYDNHLRLESMPVQKAVWYSAPHHHFCCVSFSKTARLPYKNCGATPFGGPVSPSVTPDSICNQLASGASAWECEPTNNHKELGRPSLRKLVDFPGHLRSGRHSCHLFAGLRQVRSARTPCSHSLKRLVCRFFYHDRWHSFTEALGEALRLLRAEPNERCPDGMAF